jgi:23S rRNA (cytidine1920-2'-O)/16S rRNA (cytidine1409-2'-O)-methyltransferase
MDGLAPSRERAKALIMSGVILVDDVPVTKAGSSVNSDASIRLKGGADAGYVSRGALKLAPALAAFEVSPKGRVCMDVGASTGGFTEILLLEGAQRVYAIDVGYGQMAWRLQNDERVVLLDRTNARHLTEEQVPELVSLVVMDVSFISVVLLFEAVTARCLGGADLLIMVKPQFEVGKGQVGKGGIVRDESRRQSAIEMVIDKAKVFDLACLGRRDNDLRGAHGNLETFVHFQKKNE